MQVFIANRSTVSRAAMVAHHTQHVFAVFGKAGEGAKLPGHFSRGRIGSARHDGRDGGANRAALV